MQRLLDGDSGRKSKQLVGFKSSMILDTRPQTDGRVRHLSLSFACVVFACICSYYNVSIL